MKKNHLKLTLLALIAVGALAGCQGNNKPSESESVAPSETESVTPSETESETESVTPSESTPEEIINIEIWTTIGEKGQTFINNCVTEFQELYPHIKVKNTKVGGNYDDIKNNTINGFPTGNYPDLVYCYPDHVADYIDYNKAANLDKYVNNPDNNEIGWSQEEREDVIEAYLEEGQSYSLEGTYSVPFSKSTEGLFYNADIVIGLDLSSVDSTINNGNPLNEDYINNLTWEEFFEKLAPAILKYNENADEKDKIINQTEDGDWAVMAYDSDDNFFITLAEQYGLPYTSINPTTGKGSADWDTPEMKELMIDLNSAKEKHYIQTKGTTGDYNDGPFKARQCLFTVATTGGVSYQHTEDFNINIAPIPQATEGENTNRAVINQGPSLAILKHPGANGRTDNARIEASWLFYKYMTSSKKSVLWSTTTGYAPLRYSVLESEAYIEYCDESGYDAKSLELLMAKNARYAANVVGDLFQSYVFKGSSECRQQVGGLLTACLNESSATLPNKIDELFATSVNNAKLKM